MSRWVALLERLLPWRTEQRLRRARRAEARGDLELAMERYLRAGARKDGLRLLGARIQSEPDELERLKLLSLAYIEAEFDDLFHHIDLHVTCG